MERVVNALRVGEVDVKESEVAIEGEVGSGFARRSVCLDVSMIWR